MDAQVPDTGVLSFRDDVKAFLARAKEFDGPVLSLYVDAHAEDDPKAPAQRVDAALRELPLDRAVRERLEARIQEDLRELSEAYLVLFAAEDPEELFDYRLLRLPPPLPGGDRDALARFGEALTAPVELLLASVEPVIVTYVDERRARIFVVDVGDVQETASSVRALNDEEWRDYQHQSSRAVQTSGTGGGGAGRDLYEARVEAWTARFTKALGERLGDEVARREGARLAILGETGRAEQVHEALPQHLKNVLALGGSAPADPDQPLTIWARPLAKRVSELLLEEEGEHLRHFEEVGTSTLAETLDNVQKGLLDRVAAPVHTDVEVLRCLENGWLATSEEDLREVCGDGPIERVWLKDHLLEAVRKGGSRPILLRGEAGERLDENFGGLAGVPRR